VAGVIDHANSSVTEAKIATDAVTTSKVKDLNITDPKLASGVGLSDTEICKLPTATSGKVLKRGASAWEAGDVPAPALEGDYSDWAIYDSFDDTEVYEAYWYQYAIANKAETIILLISGFYNEARKYTIEPKIWILNPCLAQYGEHFYFWFC